MTRLAAPRLIAALAALLLVAACTGGPTSAVPPVGSIEPTASASADASATMPASHEGGSAYPPGCPTAQPDALKPGETRTVTITTDKGAIAIKVEASLSPIAVGNFVALVACGYYDDVVFHRVVPKFVIQAGDGTYGRQPKVQSDFVGYGGAPYTIKDEPVTAQYTRGVVAMARGTKPDSVSSQFFIVLTDDAGKTLGGPTANNYQIIGHVMSGIDTAETIGAGSNSGDPYYLATNPVTMSKVTVATP